MNLKYVAIALVAVVVLVGVAGAAFLGIGGLGASSSGDSAVTDTPESTGTVYTVGGGGSDGGADGTATATASLPPFSFEVVNIEKCGDTCRDVTVELTNNQDSKATNVEVYTQIFAGNTTDKEDRIWEGTEDLGTLNAGESTRSTKRVELSYGDALEVQNNDGWITILTTVSSDETTITFKERRNVT